MPILTKIAMRDVVPSRRLGGGVHPLLTPASVGASAGFLGTMTLEVGEFIAAHLHPYSDEFLFVVDGVVVVRLDEGDLWLSAAEAAMIPRHTGHRIENGGTEPALIVFQMAPLAPTPAEGHIELEAVPFPDAAPPAVGD